MSPEGTRAADSSNRNPGYNAGAGGGGRGNLPYSRNYVVAGGLLVAAAIGYYTFYYMFRPYAPNRPSRHQHDDANTNNPPPAAKTD